ATICRSRPGRRRRRRRSAGWRRRARRWSASDRAGAAHRAAAARRAGAAGRAGAWSITLVRPGCAAQGACSPRQGGGPSGRRARGAGACWRRTLRAVEPASGGAWGGARSAGGSGEPARVVLVVVAGEEGAQVVDHAIERLGDEQQRLVAGDVVVLRTHGRDVPGADLGGAERLDLAVGRQQARAVGPQLAVLPQDAELEREPEHPREEVQSFVR